MTNKIKRVCEILSEEGVQSLYKTCSKLIWMKIYRNFASRRDTAVVINIDPHEITRYTPRPRAIKNRWNDISLLAPGKWDQWSTKQFDNTIFYRSLVQRYEEGTNWEDTILYNETAREIDRRGVSYSYKYNGYSTRQELKNRLSYIDKIYQSISLEGYKTKEKLKNNITNEVELGSPHDSVNEVMIDLSRTGEPLFVNGKHRLGLAKILNIDRIPALVIFHHSKLDCIDYDVVSKYPIKSSA